MTIFFTGCIIIKNTKGNESVKREKLIEKWLEEERIAHIKGWDFSHIEGRYKSDGDLPWDYKEEILRYLKRDMRLLDIDTGGGEFLLSLGHPHDMTAATEAYPPNVRLCEDKLIPLGIDFRAAIKDGRLPFDDASFDMVIDRHGDLHPDEIYRVLKCGGMFITQQVGAENDRELVEMLFDDVPEMPFTDEYLDIAVKSFEKRGFSILNAQEAYRPISFYDVGALVWFAHIIEWEFPGFTVGKCLDRLLKLQDVLERDGEISGRIHRFLLAAVK